MCRALLLAVSMFAAAACGKQDASQEVAASAPAGTVTEVVGQVTVAGKPLAVGATVTADDEVATGADGRFAIVLAHNHATWQLGANHKGKARDSIAWGMAMVQGSAAATTAIATSAGRNGERAAADTDVNAPAAKEEAAPAAGGAPGAPAAAAAAPTAAAPVTGGAPGAPAPSAAAPVTGGAPGASAPTAAAPTTAAPPPPPPMQPPAAVAPTPPKAVAPTSPKPDTASRSEPAPAPKGAPRHAKSMPDDDDLGDPGLTRGPGNLAQDHAASTLRANPKIRACVTHAPQAHLVVACTAGKCSLSSVDAGGDAACLRDAVGKIGLPAGDYTVAVDVKAPGR